MILGDFPDFGMLLLRGSASGLFCILSIITILCFYVRLQNSLVDGPKHDTATENFQSGGLCHDLGSHRAIFVS